MDRRSGAAPNTLSARLKDLEAHGLIERKLYSEHPPRLEYHLTEKGRTLGPVMKALREWGQKHTSNGEAGLALQAARAALAPARYSS